MLPDGVDAVTGDRGDRRGTTDISADFLGFLETFLLVFAVIALLVGTFSIYNTFSIIVAQRTRERRPAAGPSARPGARSSVRHAARGARRRRRRPVIGVGRLGVLPALTAVLGAFGFGFPSAAMSL